MKAWHRLFLASVCIPVCAFGANPTHDPSVPAAQRELTELQADVHQVDAEVRRIATTSPQLYRILLCTRNLVEQNKGDLQGITFAARYLDLARRQANDAVALAQVTASCETSLETLPTGTSSRPDQLAAARSLSGEYSRQARDLVAAFIAPVVTCKQGGIAASAALILSVGLKLDAGYCRSTDGKRWILVAPGVGGGLGFGVEVDGNGKTLTRPSFFHRFPLSLSSTSTFVSGMILALKGEADTRLFDNIPFGNGYGVGIGFHEMKYGSLDGAIPLPTDETYLLRQLLD